MLHKGLFLPLAVALMLPAEPLTQSDRERLIAHFELTSSWRADEVRGLSQSQLESRPQVDAWSVLDVVEHLNTAEPQYWAMDAWQGLLMVPAHSQRQILQIREIKAHPQFPRP